MKTKFDSQMKAQIQDKLRRRKSIREMAFELGVSAGTIRNWLKQYPEIVDECPDLQYSPKKYNYQSPAGRPSEFKEEYIDEAYRLCVEFGATLDQLANMLDVSIMAVRVWRDTYPEFKSAIIKGQDEYYEGQVEKSLLRAAIGYEYKETFEEVDFQGNLKTKEAFKQKAPNVVALIFWLANRMPDRWKHTNQLVSINNNVNTGEGDAEGGRRLADLSEDILRSMSSDELRALRRFVERANGESGAAGPEPDREDSGGTPPHGLH